MVLAEYEYDGMNRRIRKHVQNFGTGVVAGSDEGETITGIAAGNRDEHHYYAGWRVIEERDSSSPNGHVLAQTVYGIEYIDAPVCRDRNTDVSDGQTGDDDCLDPGGSERYFYHQDVNYRVIALTDENADVVERYDYAAYGEPCIYAGYDSTFGGEVGKLLAVSSVGNPYLHQGLRRDDETGLHENRMRAYNSHLGRFIQRDPTGYVDSLNLYLYLRGVPISRLDPLGLQSNPLCDQLEQDIDLYNDQIDALTQQLEAQQNLVQELDDQLLGLQDQLTLLNVLIGPTQQAFADAVAGLRKLGVSSSTIRDILTIVSGTSAIGATAFSIAGHGRTVVVCGRVVGSGLTRVGLRLGLWGTPVIVAGVILWLDAKAMEPLRAAQLNAWTQLLLSSYTRLGRLWAQHDDVNAQIATVEAAMDAAQQQIESIEAKLRTLTRQRDLAVMAHSIYCE